MHMRTAGLFSAFVSPRRNPAGQITRTAQQPHLSVTAGRGNGQRLQAGVQLLRQALSAPRPVLRDERRRRMLNVVSAAAAVPARG
jgi:hypothetical protein